MPTTPDHPRHHSWNPITRYMRWLHTQWPAGEVETLPVVNEDGTTNVPGVYVVGDLKGVPLLKFSADTGVKAVRRIAEELKPAAGKSGAAGPGGAVDLAIIGAGVAGMAAALEAKKLGLNFVVLEAAEAFSTIINFPKRKPIYTYPTQMTPEGDLQFHAEVKEPLIDELREQTHGIEVRHARVEQVTRGGGMLEVSLTDAEPIAARRVIIAIGRSGNFRKLDVPGEDLDKVSNRLHDPKDFADKEVLVVGGGDSALETAIAIAQVGGRVTLSYRRPEFSRPKPANVEQIEMLKVDPMAEVGVEQPHGGDRTTTPSGGYLDRDRKPGRITLALPSKVKEIRSDSVVLEVDGSPKTIDNDYVFTMIGRDPPLDFFRKSGVKIHNERTAWWWISLIAFMAFAIWMYHWKKSGVHITGIERIDTWLDLGAWWKADNFWPFNMPGWLGSIGGAWNNPANLLGVLKIDLGQPGFYYSFAYCACVVIFGIDRMRRRRTPYVKWQTITLMLVQCIPLFILPYILLPWAGHNGWFESGTALGGVADHLFEKYDQIGHERAYWRAFGFVLAWPLFFYNVFNDQPLWTWLIISFVQTFVLIPAMVFFWGKGAYCGWICSCGALAETLGDRHRSKMPHGPFWNRFNMLGQAFLAFAFVLLGLRIVGWVFPSSFAGHWYDYLLHRLPVFNYAWFVDLLWAGIFGVGLYFWFSGRVWCRFGCPLAALMHIYHRFSRFAILADKKKCISCNVCTSVCHQGIDVMNFANKGLPMIDPECVRCSACVQMCPTGVLSFGKIDRAGNAIGSDPAWLAASPVRMSESKPMMPTVNGKKVRA